MPPLPPLPSVDQGKGDQRLGGLGRARLKIRDFGDEATAAWSEPAPALHPASFPHLPFSLTTPCCFSWAPGSVFELSRALSFPRRLPWFRARLAASRESLAPSRVVHPRRLTRPLSLAAGRSPGICGHPHSGPVSWEPDIALAQASTLHIGIGVGTW